MNKSQTSLYQALDTYVNIKTGVGINGCSVMILDCQTEAKCLFCDDCFVRKTCKWHVNHKNWR